MVPPASLVACVCLRNFEVRHISRSPHLDIIANRPKYQVYDTHRWTVFLAADCVFRTGMSTIPSLQDPVTTTKALLLHVVTPRTFVKACDTAQTTPIPSPPPKERKKPKLKTLLERKSTGDEASLSTAVASALREDPNECGTNNLALPPPPPPAAAELGEREYSQEVTQEEAAAVTIQAAGDSDDDMGGAVDTTIINMEELLRIAFHKLALEWHLLNVPTYSVVAQLSKLVVAEPQDDDEEGREGSLHFRIEIQEPSDNDLEDADGDGVDEWVQVSVMVRPASLELVLGRLERIGVGSNCGTVTVLKAELCRTASPLAHQMPTLDPAEMLAEASNGVVHPLTSQDTADPNVNNEQMAKERAIEAAKQEWKNAATRLRIEQVREQIVEQAAFSLDFIALLTVASILAAVGKLFGLKSSLAKIQVIVCDCLMHRRYPCDGYNRFDHGQHCRYRRFHVGITDHGSRPRIDLWYTHSRLAVGLVLVMARDLGAGGVCHHWNARRFTLGVYITCE